VHVIFAAAMLAQIHTGQDLLEACRAKDKTACDAFIKQTIKTDPAAACFKVVPAEDARNDVLHELGANETQGNGFNQRDAAALVAELFANECNSRL
jgi:hypothetical protein